MISWLEHDPKESHRDIVEAVYSLDKVKSKFEIKDIDPGYAWLVLNRSDEFWLKFAVLEFFESEIDDVNMQATCLFHGEGTLGSLRECRHTYWGENGYLFYPNGRIITKAFEALSEFFDDMIT